MLTFNVDNGIPVLTVYAAIIRTVTHMTYAFRYAPNESVLKFKQALDEDGYQADLTDTMTADRVMYQVGIRTKPGDASYEGTVTYIVKEDKFESNKLHISRTNMYGNQPQCLMDQLPHLEKYCYCKVQVQKTPN